MRSGCVTVPPPSLEPPLKGAPALEVEHIVKAYQSDMEPGILRVPVEVVLKVLELTDLRSAFSLIRSSKTLKRIWDGNREHIMMAILQTELSPFDDLLQVVVSKPEDIKLYLGPCLRRQVYHRNRLCCEGDVPQRGEEAHALLPPAVLTEEHFDRLLHLFGVVRGWEQIFPRYHFGSDSDRRDLYPREARRLRAAIFRWMSYAYFFHGELPRPSKFVPQKYSTDVRCKRLRLLSDAELHELNDLWETVQKVVQTNICPSTEMVLKQSVSPRLPTDCHGREVANRMGNRTGRYQRKKPSASASARRRKASSGPPSAGATPRSSPPTATSTRRSWTPS